jgi:hypothetical protein
VNRLVIDTDPGVDDAHAIMLAFAHPEAQVEAITTVIFRTIMGQVFSPKLGHAFSPKLGHGDAGGTPLSRAYFRFSEPREQEETCPERGKGPWRSERC